MIIKTKDFILRHKKISDLEGYYETETDELTKKMHMSFPKNLSEAKKDLQKSIKNYSEKPRLSESFTIEVNGKYAGSVTIQFQNFDVKGKEGRVHISIHPEFRSKGLATKVLKKITDYGFKKYKFKRIFAQCKLINKAIARVNEKVGFKLEKIHTVDGTKKMWWVLERK